MKTGCLILALCTLLTVPCLHVSGEDSSGVSPEENGTGNSSHYWAEGFSLGTSFSTPWLIVSVHKSFSPLRNSFLEIGCDLGFISSEKDADYYSVYPFAHIAYFRPFGTQGGWYAGAGGGFMIARYLYSDGEEARATGAFDLIAGVNLLDFLQICYTLRTNFSSVNHKVSVGYVITR